MEKPTITRREIDNFNLWYDTKDPRFTEISQRSNIPQQWLAYQRILEGKNKDSIIKPINRYVERLVPPPKLVSIDGNTIRLRQGNHAEMFLLEKEDGEFYNVDRPWQRQYYNTALDFDGGEECFPGTFKFYVPWFVDANVMVHFLPSDVSTPFKSYATFAQYSEVPKTAIFVEPHFVAFNFKRVGTHMINDKFGKIPKQSAMYDMVFTVDDIMVERVKEFYEQHN